MTNDTSYSDAYCGILKDLISPATAVHDHNARTGKRIRVLRGGRSFQVDLARRLEIPVPGNRRVFPRTAAAEIAWFLMGTEQANWIRANCAIWDSFIEDDGSTIKGAYGYRWRNAFRRDQVALAIEALKNDPSDRRVYVSAWDPAADGLGAKGQRNVPCPVGFSLSLLAGEVQMTVTMRSSDVFVGLPYDVMGHALLLDAFATTLGARPGVLQMTLAHPHLYEPHWEMASNSLNQERFHLGPRLPGWTIKEIEEDPDGYVKAVHEASVLIPQHPYHIKPELVL